MERVYPNHDTSRIASISGLTSTPKGSGKDTGLLIGGIEPIFVGSLLFHGLDASIRAVSCQAATLPPRHQTRNGTLIPSPQGRWVFPCWIDKLRMQDDRREAGRDPFQIFECKNYETYPSRKKEKSLDTPSLGSVRWRHKEREGFKKLRTSKRSPVCRFKFALRQTNLCNSSRLRYATSSYCLLFGKTLFRVMNTANLRCWGCSSSSIGLMRRIVIQR